MSENANRDECVRQTHAPRRSHLNENLYPSFSCRTVLSPGIQSTHYGGHSGSHHSLCYANPDLPLALGSGIAATAINAKLHHYDPLKITVRSDAGSETMATLLRTPDWEPVEARYGKAATTVLEHTPKRRTLSRGILTDGLTIKSRFDG